MFDYLKMTALTVFFCAVSPQVHAQFDKALWNEYTQSAHRLVVGKPSRSARRVAQENRAAVFEMAKGNYWNYNQILSRILELPCSASGDVFPYTALAFPDQFLAALAQDKSIEDADRVLLGGWLKEKLLYLCLQEEAGMRALSEKLVDLYTEDYDLFIELYSLEPSSRFPWLMPLTH